MIVSDTEKEMAVGVLCASLGQLLKEPFGRGKYRELVYAAMLAANTLGYNTGIVLGKTHSGSAVVDAVIALPTGVVTFRLPWFLGALGEESGDPHAKAIEVYLHSYAHAVLPLMRDPNRCCTRCHVWETREGTYCHHTNCSCHRRR